MFAIRPAWRLIVVLAAATFATRAGRAESIYHLTPYSIDAGFSIDSGSIVVVDSAPDDLLLETNEILTFTVHATDEAGSFSFSGTGANAHINGPVDIANASISVAFPSNFKDENLMLLEDPGSLAYAQWLSLRLGDDFGSVSLSSRTGSFEDVFVTAPITVASMPEPRSMLLFLMGGIALFTSRQARRKARTEK